MAQLTAAAVRRKEPGRTKAVRRLILVGSVLGTHMATHAYAQQPPPSVSLSWGVDTTDANVHDIVRLVRAYFAKPDSSARSRGLWSTATEFDRRVGDLTLPMGTYQGFPATIVGVTSDVPGDSVYTIKVLHAQADSTGRRVNPLALQRLYAVREPGAPFRFRLASALPRLTSHWQRRSSGRMTFLYAPGQRPDSKKIAQAARFVDSVAKLFEVPAPSHLDVYVTASVDESIRVIGLDFFVHAGPGRGGSALPFNIVLAGDPALGEAYLHEFVHVVLGPTFPANNGLFNEGVATWLGGSQARTPQQLYAILHQYQRKRPTLGLADLLRGGSQAEDARAWTDAHRATGALVVDTIYRRTGISGLRAFALTRGNPDVMIAALPKLLGVAASDPEALDNWWRSEAERASKRR